MSLTGQITINIESVAPAETRVRITSSRPTDVAKILKGRTPDAALHLMPMIFSACGQAHRFAAATACGQTDGAGYRAELTVLMERAREHLLRIFMDWVPASKAPGPEPQLQAIMGLVGEMQAAVGKSDGPNAFDRSEVTAVTGALRQQLQRDVFGISARSWLDLGTDTALARWAEDTDSVAARFINDLYRRGLQSLGGAPVRRLPVIPADELTARLHGEDGHNFVAQPDWREGPCETGPLSEHYDHALVSDLRRRYGIGVLARNVARLVDLAQIPDEMEAGLSAGFIASSTSFPGLARVNTARGQLVHSVRMRRGQITDYKILAPTEWNFHPEGAVRNSLKAMCAQHRSEREALSELIVGAIDPCVACDVRFN